MKQNLFVIRSTFLAILGCATLYGFECSNPNNSMSENASYNVLLHNRCCSRQFYVFNASERMFVDSFSLPKFNGIPTLSADGRKLFIPYDSLYVYSWSTKQIIRTLPFTTVRYVSVSKDGKYIAVCTLNDGVYLLNAHTFDTLLIYPEDIVGCDFSLNGSQFFVWDYDKVILYSVTSTVDSIDSYTRPVGINGQIHMDPGRNRVYMYALEPGQFSNVIQFEVYELPGWTRSYVYQVSAGQGGMEVSPNGRYVLFTNPGGLLPPSGDERIRVYDADANMVIQEIETLLQFPSAPVGSPGEVFITPDSRWAVTAPIPAGGSVCFVDLERLLLDTIINLGDTNRVMNWITGPKR